MKTVKELLSYLTAVGLLVLGLGAGSVWLLSPDPTMKAEAKAPIVPQKFLDSIERKKPVQVDVVAPVQAVVPVMHPWRAGTSIRGRSGHHIANRLPLLRFVTTQRPQRSVGAADQPRDCGLNPLDTPPAAAA